MPRPRQRIDLIAHYPGQDPWACAHRNADDADGITRITEAHLADGATRVTVLYQGTEYDPAEWNAYTRGETTRITPLEG